MDSVVQKLATSPELRTLIDPSCFSSEGKGDCQLQDGTIRGLCHFSHDGRPRLQKPTRDSKFTFDVTATVLVKNVVFDAFYEFASVSGMLEGRVEIVRIHLLIGGE